MSELGKYWEREELQGGVFKHIQHLRPIAFHDGTNYKRINPNWKDADDGHFVVDNAPFRVLTYPTGGRRVYPIRDDPDRWIEIGRPRTKVLTQWQAMNHGALACKDNALSGSRINTGLDIVHGGHFISWELELKNRPLLGVWKPADNLLAFPYELRGLDFKGNVLYADSKPVMRMRQPVVFDRGGEDARSVRWSHQTIDGQRCLLYTLPDISGMKRPIVDPTLTLQPDATAGKDTYIGAAGFVDNNFGVFVYTRCNANDKTLIQFDVSSIPATATIDNAILTMFTKNETVNTVSLHRGLVEWFEGEKDTAPPGATDGSTWNHRNANTGGQIAWTGGAGGAGDIEFVAAATATATPSDDETDEVFGDAKVDVQNWVDGTYTNYGWWMTQDGVDDWYAASSDYATAADRPKLVVEYTIPATGMVRSPMWGRYNS